MESNNIIVQHCPALEMLADFLTKPLQGNLFRHFRNILLGNSHINTLQRYPAVPIEERVGKEQPCTRDVTPPGTNEWNEERVNGKGEMHKATWAGVVGAHTTATKVGEVMREISFEESTFSKQSC